MPVIENQAYLIRVGGFGTQTGTGTLSLSCVWIGACCDGGGGCVESTQAACGGGNTYVGDGTACNPNPCSQPCTLFGDVDGNTTVNGKDIAGYIRAKLGHPPASGENQACADYGTGSVGMDTVLFIDDLLN